MSICFISNYTKTFFFLEVAKLLQQQGYRICWIIVDKKYLDLLRQHFSEGALLYIGRHYATMHNEPVGEFKINELLYTDRVLRYNKEWGYNYLLHIQKPIYQFLQNHTVNTVVGELTWAHELLVHRMLQQKKELNCRFLNPHTIRIPNGRFAFFADEFQSEILPRPRLTDHPEAEDQGKGFALAKPSYLHSNNLLIKKKNSLGGLLQRTQNFFLNKHHNDPNDPTRFSKTQIINDRLLEQKRIYTYYYKVKRYSFSRFDKQPFLIYSLHKQPEASIDVMGRYYEDQLQNIINVWRILPQGWCLLVKEHTNAIGDRSRSFYKTLQQYKGIYLVHESEDMAQMVRLSQGVFTVSGTVAIEALLQGKMAFTFARNFFNGYGSCYHIRLEDLKYATGFSDMCAQLRTSHSYKGTIAEYQQFVLQHSYAGIIGDVLHTPGAMEPENIKMVATALTEVVPVGIKSVVV